jgi:hypothetical protein
MPTTTFPELPTASELDLTNDYLVGTRNIGGGIYLDKKYPVTLFENNYGLPTVSLNTAALGLDATASIIGNDKSFVLVLTTGIAYNVGQTRILTINLSRPYSDNPIVNLTMGSLNCLTVESTLYNDYLLNTVSSLQLNIEISASLNTGQTYYFQFFIGNI